MKESIVARLHEIQKRLEGLESNLPRHVDAMAVSQSAKLPFKALTYRETLIWRMAELSRAAFTSFENSKLASAIVLIRAAVETSAALWYLCEKIEAAVQSEAVGDIDNYLMRLSLGSRVNSDVMPEAINVMTFIDQVEKTYNGFRHQYDLLSEYAHPNWPGTGLLLSKPDTETLRMDFGQNLRGAESSTSIGAENLGVALVFFERSYNRIADLMPAFITLCENHLNSKGSDWRT